MMATAGSITGAWATVNSGMVILGHDAPAGQLSASTIEVKYLSTGKTIVIENGAACNPVFSPDGRKIAFFHRTLTANLKWTKHYLYTVNVDGSDRKKITTYGDNSRAPEWCTDGYIYFCTRFDGAWRIARVPETGGDYEVVDRKSVV